MIKLGPFIINSIILRNQTISPEEILHEVQKRLYFIEKNQIARQTPLGIIAEANLNTVYWMYTAFLSGRIFSPLPVGLTSSEEKKLCSHFSSDFFIIKGHEDLSWTLKNERLFSPSQGEEIMAYIFSSGSTSAPKRLGLTFNNFDFQAKAHKIHNEQRPNDCWLASLPLFHIGGINIFTRALLLGQPIAFDGKFSIEKYSYWITHEKITALSLIPTMLYRLLSQEGIQISPKIKLILIGGGALDENLKAKAIEKKWPIKLSYGMTETCSQIYSGTSFLPGVQAKISSTNEILIACPMLSPDSIKDADGFYATGDLGEINSKGELKILGRIKTVMNSGGQKISPEEIEMRILQHPSIAEAAAFGRKDQEWGEKVILVYVLKKGHYVKKEDLFTFLRQELSSKKIPKEIFQVESLPRTSNGKIARSELTQLQEHDGDNH